MTRMTRRLFRERRRAVITYLLLLIAGAVTFGPTDGLFPGQPLAILGPVFFSAVLGTIFLAWGLVFPAWRHCSEAAALGIVIAAVLARVIADASILDPAFRAQTVLATAALIWLIDMAYAYHWLDALLPKRRVSIPARARSVLPPDRLWPALARTPETMHLDPDPVDQRIEWIEPGRRMRIHAQVPGVGQVEEDQIVEHAEPGRLWSISYRVVSGPDGVAGSSGALSFRLRPGATGTEVLTRRTHDALSLRAKLYVWIDDAFGRVDDEKLDRIAAAAGV